MSEEVRGTPWNQSLGLGSEKRREKFAV